MIFWTSGFIFFFIYKKQMVLLCARWKYPHSQIEPSNVSFRKVSGLRFLNPLGGLFPETPTH
jgi:hypothetical protein